MAGSRQVGLRGRGVHLDFDPLGLLFDRKTERTQVIGELDDLPLLARRQLVVSE